MTSPVEPTIFVVTLNLLDPGGNAGTLRTAIYLLIGGLLGYSNQ